MKQLLQEPIKMLKKIQIHNFKSHVDSILEFVPGINVLVGSSYSGKSNILKSIFWNVKNEPLGEGIFRKGTEESLVSTEWEVDGNNFEVLRKRNKSENSYSITGMEPFTAFGTKPPKEISEAINILEVNIQDQHSPFFLIFETPGQIASYIRSVTGLSDIDMLSDNIASQLRKKESNLNEVKESLKLVDEKLQVLLLIPLTQLEDYINLFEKSEKEKDVLKNKNHKIQLICLELKQLNSQVIFIPENRVEEISEVFQKLVINKNDLNKQASKLKRICDDLVLLNSQTIIIPERRFLEIQEELKRLTESYKKQGEKKQQLDSIVISLEKLKRKIIDVEISDFGTDLISEYNRLTAKLVDLYNKLKEIAALNEQLINDRDKLGQLRKEEKAILGELKNCPHCGSELTEETKLTLLSEGSCGKH